MLLLLLVIYEVSLQILWPNSHYFSLVHHSQSH